LFLQSLQLSEVAGLEAWRLPPKTEPNSPPKAQAEAEPKSKGDIRYTYTDESSMLATGTFCPTDHALGGQADVAGELKDISVTGRVFASFPVLLKEDQRIREQAQKLPAEELAAAAKPAADEAGASPTCSRGSAYRGDRGG